MPPVQPPLPPTGPTAKFTKTGAIYATSPDNHSITFSDASVKGTGTITNWLWNFGDGTTYSGQTPPAHTYTNSSSSNAYNVTLTVTDSNALTATYTETFTLYKLPAVPPYVPPVLPPAPSATISVECYTGSAADNFSFTNGAPVGSGVVEGAGRVSSYHYAVPSNSYAGAFYDWTVTVNSGTALTNVVEGGTANNRLDLVLLDPTPSTTPLESVVTIQVDYKYANGLIIGTKTLPFTLRTKNVVSTVTPPSFSGGGGCVASDSYLTNDLKAYEVAVGHELDGYSAIDGVQKMVVTGRNVPFFRDSVRITTESGATLRCSKDTPFTLRHSKTDGKGGWVMSPKMLGEEVLVDRDGVLTWETVVSIDEIGTIEVIPLNVSDRSFAAGDVPNVRVYSHNAGGRLATYHKV